MSRDELVIPSRRGADQTKLEQLVSRFKVYIFIANLVVIILLAIGFNFTTPATAFKRVNQRIDASQRQDSVLQARLAGLEARLDLSDSKLNAVTIDACLRRKADIYAYRQMGCAVLMQDMTSKTQ